MSLDYRSPADVDDIDGTDGYFFHITSGNDDTANEYDNIIMEVDEEEEEEDEDPLSRALTRRTTHRRDHFPDAVRDLLKSIPLPQLPPNWVVTSEAMEAIVGGARAY